MRQWLILLSLLLPVFHTTEAGNRRALLIGISEYPLHRQAPDLSWPAIHGTNDIAVIGKALRRQQFAVTTLTNHNATAEKIRAALTRLASETHAGDLVYIHFSGHGQAYEDLSGDEDDGWDEALVPYDAMMAYRRGIYDGGKHIIDDELQKFVTAIRQRAGTEGYVYVILDACHSGGASRGNEEEDSVTFVRGTDKAFSPNGRKYIPKIDRRGNIKIHEGKNLAGVCFIEACRAYQTNSEIKESGTHYGPLTYYINRWLSSHRLSANAAWTEQVRAMMDRDPRLIRQNMVIEKTE